MQKMLKYQIPLLIVLVAGFIVLQLLLTSHYDSEKTRERNELVKTHSESVLKVKTGINVYSTVVASIRSFVENSDGFPTEIQLHDFLNDLIKDIDFKDSIIVSWVDTNQIFQYVVTPYQIDPSNLKGLNVGELRTESEITELNNLMYSEKISLFNPINLREGWAALPFNFSAKNSEGKVLGYFAPVLNVKYLLDYTYGNGLDSNFVHRFLIEDTIAFTREAVYDGSVVYNKKRDLDYYKNFDVDESTFINSEIEVFGLKLKIGTAYKTTPKKDHTLAIIAYLWFGLMCVFVAITLYQFIRNNTLNKRLKTAHYEIAVKNEQLEKNLNKIQTLIKEIHHRVKNNMQIISSLLNLQSKDIKDLKISEALNTSKGRIQSMSLVHQKLYGTEDLSSIKVVEYVEQLVHFVETTLNENKINSVKEINISDDLIFNMDTMVPLGLILNELITNSFKYAFTNSKNNKLNISIVESGDGYALVYKDNGPGLPDNIDLDNIETLGLELVNILAVQLGGSFEYLKTPESTFTVKFKQV